MLKDWQDAFGHGMYDYLKGEADYEIGERDDGHVASTGGPGGYFREYHEWSEAEQEAMEYVRGRVLDIGCGAGRHSLYLQEQGFDVVGIDNSSLAVNVCWERGLRDVRLLPVTQVSRRLGVFDTILMMGNNFALAGNPTRARWLLRRFRGATSEAGRIIAGTRDPYATNEREHLEYHEFNRKRGRLSGQVRIRIRYKKYATPWFDLLLVSRDEMKSIIKGTGWVAREFMDIPGGNYIAILEKTGA